MDAAEEAAKEYVVEKHDTLRSISLKFNIPIHWLMEINNLPNDFVYTGQKLRICEPGPMDKMETATNIIFLNPQEDNSNQFSFEDIGTLTCKSGLLSFSPDCARFGRLFIDLTAHLQSTIIPVFPIPDYCQEKAQKVCDDQVLSLLVITYLAKKDDPFSLSTARFAGKNEKLAPIYDLLVKQAEIIQKKENYTVPSISPQDMQTMDKVTATKGKRRNSIPNLFKKKAEDLKPSSLDSHIQGPMPIRLGGPQSLSIRPQQSLPLHPPLPPMAPPSPQTPTKRPKKELRKITLIGTSAFLTDDIISNIRNNLPYHFRTYNWELLYQLSTHGASYSTFFEKCLNTGPVVFLLLTDKSEVIGSFISSGFKKSNNYYGTGETFVFSCQPEFKAYKWQNSNQYFVSTSKDEIAIGGGGSSAIWLDGHLLNAYSEPCSTFSSPSLTSSYYFKISNIEVWKIGYYHNRH